MDYSEAPGRIVDEILRADPVIGWAFQNDGTTRVIIDTVRRTLVITVAEMQRYRVPHRVIDDIVHRTVRELGEQAADDAQKRDKAMTLAAVEQMKARPRVSVNDLISRPAHT